MENSVAIVTTTETIDFSNITRIEYHGPPVLTTEQLAEFYGTKVENLKMNFNNNKERFVLGKHYFKLEGEELELLRVKHFYLQISPKTRILYLWTKQGCARHCKSIGTNVAWDVFEKLEDNYFNADKPIASISNFELGKEIARLARSSRNPQIKERLVARAANLLLGENFIDEIPKPQVQISLF